jgi:uncharacterized repeat protein (TIGR01451 family)
MAEAFLRNNSAWADVRVALDGPTQLSPGQTVTYWLWVDNVGGRDAKNTRLRIILPLGLTSSASLTWNLVHCQVNSDSLGVAKPHWW